MQAELDARIEARLGAFKGARSCYAANRGRAYGPPPAPTAPSSPHAPSTSGQTAAAAPSTSDLCEKQAAGGGEVALGILAGVWCCGLAVATLYLKRRAFARMCGGRRTKTGPIAQQKPAPRNGAV